MKAFKGFDKNLTIYQSCRKSPCFSYGECQTLKNGEFVEIKE